VPTLQLQQQRRPQIMPRSASGSTRSSAAKALSPLLAVLLFASSLFACLWSPPFVVEVSASAWVVPSSAGPFRTTGEEKAGSSILSAAPPRRRRGSVGGETTTGRRRRLTPAPQLRLPTTTAAGKRSPFAASAADGDFGDGGPLLKDAYDHVVIGSGLGGLAAASLLAQVRKGKESVLVLEQNEGGIGGSLSLLLGKGGHRQQQHQPASSYTFGMGTSGGAAAATTKGDTSPDEAASDDAPITPRRGALPSLRQMLAAVTPKYDPVPVASAAVADDGRSCDILLLGRDALRRYDIVTGRNRTRVFKQLFPDDETAIDVYSALIDEAATAGLRGLTRYKRLPRRIVRFLLKLRPAFLRRWFVGDYNAFAIATLKEVVESVTDNPELQSAFQYGWAKYGTPPDRASFVMHALATKQVCDYAGSGDGEEDGRQQSILRNDPREITDRIRAVLKQRNCEILTGAAVRQILLKTDKSSGAVKAVGVEIQDDGGPYGGIRRRKIRAFKSVVSDAGYRNTFSTLLPPQHRKGQAQQHQQELTGLPDVPVLENGLTFLTLSVEIRGDFRLPSQPLWVYPDNVKMSHMLGRYPMQWQDMNPQDFAPVSVETSSSTVQSSTVRCSAPVPWSWFSEYVAQPSQPYGGSAPRYGDSDPGGRPGSHGPQYKSMARELSQRLWTRARQGLVTAGASDQLPRMLDELDSCDIATPLTYAHALRSEHGALFGLDHDTNRFDEEQFFLELRPDVATIRNLYLTGKDVATCGVAGSLWGGYLCAGKILRSNPSKLLQKVNRGRVLHTEVPEEEKPRGMFGWFSSESGQSLPNEQ